MTTPTPGTPSDVLRGGAWLVEDADPAAVFTPERLSEEQRLIGRTAEEFAVQEVLPNLDALERKDWTLARRLLSRAGELGLLGVDAPEAHGGLALDKTTSLVLSERIARAASFSTAHGGQVNLTILPITLFGTPEQQARYLPRLVTGEIVGAYALSEAGSGSDALGARTRAVRQPDGSFVLTGEKLWITNGGFADLFIVFGKVDGEHFTAFLVERAFPGLSTGEEERKMGLHGSSTVPLILADVPVPAANVLGEIGRGHKVAFTTLNLGRFKLGAMCLGTARDAIAQAAAYAAERRQFGQPIASFGAIRFKLGEMVARTYALQSLLYRTAGMLDARLARTGRGGEDPAGVIEALEEFAIESSIAKVAGSEILDYILDENVQIHGGNGFVRDYPAEREYRDSRVNRIFEGTNEINRQLIPGLLVRRALKGHLPLFGREGGAPAGAETGAPGDERALLRQFKRVALLVLETAVRAYGERLKDAQEVLSWTADIVIDTFAAESAVLRAEAAARGAAAERHGTAARLCVHTAAGRIELAAREALAAIGDAAALGVLRQTLQVPPIDTVTLRRTLAAEAVSKRGYGY